MKGIYVFFPHFRSMFHHVLLFLKKSETLSIDPIFQAKAMHHLGIYIYISLL